MKKKVIAMLLAATMVVSMAACGSSSETASTDTTSDSSSDTEESTSTDWSEYDALIDQIRTSTDFEARVELMHEAEDMLMDTWAVIPLYYYNDVYMQKDTIDGIVTTVYGMKYFDDATKTGDDADVLRINLASEPDYLDPALNSSVDGGCLAVNSFAGLYKYDSNSEVIPDIATDMPEVSEDGLTYTVTLQETKWSNGEDLTANDFVYSWNRVIAEETAADYAYLFDIIDRNDDGSLAVEATDDYTLTITLTNPCPYFNALMAFPTFFPVYQADVEAADTDGTNPGKWAQEAGFVSNGAYTLTSWTHNESMTYTKNEYYYDADSVSIDTLEFMLSADDTATFAAYNSGDLDFIDSVPTDEIPSVKDNDDFYVIDNLGTYYVAFNVNADLFANMTDQQAKDFRHAIALLIDRQYIVDTVGQTEQVVADSYIPAGMSDGNGGVFKTDDVSYYDATTTNVEEAVALLESAGFTMTDNGDGTYTPDQTISIPYILNESEAHQKVAECIQADLSVVGIEMTIETEDWNVFLQDRKDGNYTFAREGWLADYNDPINMLEMFTTDSGNNDPQFGK